MKRTPPNPPQDSSAKTTDEVKFRPVIDAFAGNRTVSQGKMFGSTALKTTGKVFAMFVKGKFVAKLPALRVNELVAAGSADYFDPGHGRLMKRWAALAEAENLWVGLAKEACQFVQEEAS
jgi:TfoX/Sxy family transcriptional regulator of competence genes